jgi:hypothetical protein
MSRPSTRPSPERRLWPGHWKTLLAHSVVGLGLPNPWFRWIVKVVALRFPAIAKKSFDANTAIAKRSY